MALVGKRDAASPAPALLALCRARAGACPAETDLAPRVRPLAQGAPGALAVGDILAFGPLGPDNPERLLALVTARDERGVLELFYLAGGVWRRGFVDPARPRLRRDAQGKVVNTFLRHGRARPPAGTRFLTGELLCGVVDADRAPGAPPMAAMVPRDARPRGTNAPTR
ncbi:MAG: hypothetical protein IPI49_29860 [Myxococcales bacterium]|nr:hypothetical protein [Myxococcales bacterium]